MERRENVKECHLVLGYFVCVVGYSCAQAMAGRPDGDAIGGHLFDRGSLSRVWILVVVNSWEVRSFGRSGKCGRRIRMHTDSASSCEDAQGTY